MENLVLRNDVDGLATLTLNRPDKMNALSIPLFEELEAHIDSIAADPKVHCVVIRGAGRCFSAGNDLGGIGSDKSMRNRDFQSHVVQKLADLPQPLVAGVHGHCYTGALELALAADFIVASESAKFADTHARFALVPLWGMSQRLPRRIGDHKAREMMFTCRTYGGKEAAAIGLATECVVDAEFDTAVQRWADSILAQSPHSQRAMKQLLKATDGLPLAAGLAYEFYQSVGSGPDVAERIEAFSKRAR